MPEPTIREFYATETESSTHLTSVRAGQPFTLSWACENTVRLCLIGPGGVVFDQQDADLINKRRWQILDGVPDTSTFLLSATNSEEQTTSQYLTLFVTDADKTFRNLKVMSTLTLE
ncbi:hypothetical protein [Streptomyces syringium]|uniref:hypothetical protein n=1 Tax=Streptomyces syringium TaxID=76729 RepID=UPI0034570E0B